MFLQRVSCVLHLPTICRTHSATLIELSTVRNIIHVLSNACFVKHVYNLDVSLNVVDNIILIQLVWIVNNEYIIFFFNPLCLRCVTHCASDINLVQPSSSFSCNFYTRRNLVTSCTLSPFKINFTSLRASRCTIQFH